MPWSAKQVGELLKLAETGALSDDALTRAAHVAPLTPSPQDWRAASERLLLAAGALLCATAIVFFFAYNWADLHRYTKFSLAITALAACTGIALASRPFTVAWKTALFAACVVTGALLALIGQTYQTGADPWELFAAWALLILPFALLARSTASWALWLAIANLALVRALHEQALGFVPGRWHDGAGPLLLIAAFNLAALLVFEFAARRLLVTPRRHLARLAAAFMLATLVIGAVIGWWERELWPVTVTFLFAAAAVGWCYHTLHRDLMILALTLYAAIAVFASALIRVLPDDAAFLFMNIVALFIVGTSAAAGAWIVRLYRADRSL